MKDSALYYSVGALLYCPANHPGIARSLIEEKLGKGFSLAMCLEDTIANGHVEEAISQLNASMQALYQAYTSKEKAFYMPKIFIRVRKARQAMELMERFQAASRLITGFILPKFSLENADAYIDSILSVSKSFHRDIYMMPILEDPFLTDLRSRQRTLCQIKEKLDAAKGLVLNIRVGGNDLCHLFGFRRGCQESIHGIGAISSIFSDIITAFGMDYVVSGPVWEYYDGEGWDTGLKKELKDDRLCGFVGKTVIHPKQIALVNAAYKVSQKDLDDAKAILGWDADSSLLVAGSASKERMNEYKVHTNWARKILLLSEAFGVS